MRIGIDARIARWHTNSKMSNYTNQILTYMQHIDKENKYLLLFPSEYKKKKRFDGFRHEIENNFKKNLWEEALKTKWEEDVQVDIFHNTANGIGTPKNGKHKLVVTIQDLIPYIMPETVNKQHLEYALKYTYDIIENADKIITVSNHTKKDLKRYFGLPQEKIDVIYYGIDKIFRPMNKQDAQNIIKKRYGIGDKFILHVGGVNPRKNVARLIRAFHMIYNELNEEYKLIILGKPDESFENMMKLSEKLGIKEKIVFIDFVQKDVLPFFYNACEVFVYPSLYEGFGLAPLEAAACGVPIVASNTASIPETMGDACVYISPHNIVHMAQEIYDTIMNKDQRENLSIKAFKQSKKYSWKKASKETLKVYKDLMQ
ncbi:glycosyltransferase family 1 protein [Clostridiaceae bacterium 35-E11]